MARRLKHDFSLNGKGYLLSKPGAGRGRSWHRFGVPDTPVMAGQRSEAAAQYGGVDPQLDVPEVWDDWTGGYGYAYRDRQNPNTYHWAENMDARFPHQLVHAQRPNTLMSNARWLVDPAATVAKVALLKNAAGVLDGVAQASRAAEYPQQMTVLSNNGIVQLGPNASGGWDAFLAYYFSEASHAAWEAAVTYPPALYGSYFVFGNVSGTFWTARDYFSYNWDADQGNGGFHFAVAGNQLWRSAGSNPEHAIYLQNCGNPNALLSASNWGATYRVGDSNAPIKTLIACDDQVFAGTPRGLFAGDQSGTFVNVLGQLAYQTHPDNCRDLAIFEGAVVAPHVSGVYAYRPSTGLVEDMGLPHADRSPVTGNARAVRSFGRYLYAGLYTGSQTYLLAGERQGQRMAWHTLQRLPGVTKAGRLYVDGITTCSLSRVPNHFWVTTEASIDPGGTAPIYYWSIPTLDGNPLMPSAGFSANYCGSARIDFGSVDLGAPGTLKAWRAVEVWSESLASGAQWADVYYSLDEGQRVKLGTVARSPKDTLFFSSGEGSFVTSLANRISVESFTASSGVTPVYRAFVLRGSLLPRFVDEVDAVVRIADDMTDRQGQKMRPASQMIAELRDLANVDRQGNAPHVLVDPTGAAWNVKLLAPPEEQEVWVGAGETQYPELAVAIRMGILTYTAG